MKDKNVGYVFRGKLCLECSEPEWERGKVAFVESKPFSDLVSGGIFKIHAVNYINMFRIFSCMMPRIIYSTS